MYEWQKQIQIIVDEIDSCIKNYQDEALTLRTLSQKLGYSEYYTTRKFKEISGMNLREYLQQRKLAFALKEIRDSEKSILKIALAYGFSSHEAFTRAFKAAYGRTPSAYRKQPSPVVLRTKINPFNRYLLGLDELGEISSEKAVKTYFVTIPAHKFLFIENRESNGRLCDWGYLRTECYGVRLPVHYTGDVPHDMQLLDIAEAEYLVFEHRPFDYEQENRSVEHRMEDAMTAFDFTNTGYCFDDTPGRMLYFYFQPERCWKYIRPVKRRMQ